MNNAIPNQLTMSGQPFKTLTRTGSRSFYVQDQTTFGRLTLQGALRYDYAYSRFLDQQVGPVRFIPVPIVIPAQDGVMGFHDLSPRVGAAYDLLGDGRTSVRVNWGRYLEAASNAGRYTATNPLSRIVTSTTRTWTDANGNFSPDCDLLNPAPQDLRPVGGDFCAQWGNQNFGSSVPGTEWDPALLQGWGVRPNDGQLGISVQREILPRASVEVGYHRRWFKNFTVTDNLLVTSADYDPYSVFVPADPRLPKSDGYVIGDQWNISEAKFGQSQNLVSAAESFGEQTQVLARRGHQLQRAGTQWLDVPGRHEHRPRGRRRMRGRRRQSDASRLPRHRTVPNAGQGSGHLHDSEGGRAGQRHVPEPSWRGALCELDGGERPDRNRHWDDRSRVTRPT